MNADQVVRYIGLPWAQDGNGPNSWNCWNLLRHILREYFQKEIPTVDLQSGDELRALYEAKLDSRAWVKRDDPAHGHGVLLREGMHPHVGIYLDIDGGGVLHSLEGVGVVFTPLGALRMLGFSRVTYYEVVR